MFDHALRLYTQKVGAASMREKRHSAPQQMLSPNVNVALGQIQTQLTQMKETMGAHSELLAKLASSSSRSNNSLSARIARKAGGNGCDA
jgi:hypothetical protein